MFPAPTDLLLIGYSIESVRTPRSKSNTLTPRTNSQTYWQREIAHVMNGIIFCVCLTLAISVLPIVSEVMSKRMHKGSGEERVTAKSKPMMSLVSRCSEKGLLTCFASVASESAVKTRYESQLTLSSWIEQHLRTVRLVKDASSKEWTSDESMEVRTGRLVNAQPHGLFTQHTDRFIVDYDDMELDTVAESDMSLKSRSFLHSVKNRVRKVMDQSSKDATQDNNKHSVIWGMFMSSTLQASVFMWKNYLENLHSNKKYRKRSHNETDVRHIWKVDRRTIRWDPWSEYNWFSGKILHGSIYLWLVMKKSSVSRTRRFTYFQILCFALERWVRTHNQIFSGKTSWRGSKSSSQYRALDTIDGEPMEFEWNIFPGFTALQLCNKVQEFLSNMSTEPEDFTGRIIFMSMFNDISWGSKDNEQEN